ncbi:MAG TPA: ABC transporter substrate-binding protein [Thermomicrobiales bacterium]|jgi:multiple sugar transport system substrate-binding protein/sn-glycerol 3-phosphate transport system substrate-binding protein
MKKETERVMFAKRQWSFLVAVLTAMLVLSACGAGTATVAPSAAPSAAPSTGASTGASTAPSTAASAAPSTAASAAPTSGTGAAGGASTATTARTATAGGATGTGATPSAGINAGGAAAANNYGLKPGSGSAVDNVTISAPVTITFWHSQTNVNAENLTKVINEFMAKNPNIKIDAQYQGSYTDIFKKTTAAINGGGLPDLSVSYESFVSEYQAANVVLPLDDYINSSKYGLSAQDLQDFYPVYIAGNQYAEYNNQMLSFPFTKSALVMYYNADKLKEAGLTPPKNWEEFVSSCKKFTGDVKGYAINTDASTFNGAVYSNGGKLINDDRKSWAFNGPAGIKFLRDIGDMVQSGCAYQISKANDDQAAFGEGKVVFTLGTTSGLSFYKSAVDKGAKFNWNVAMIPQGGATTPVTTAYGGNVNLFKSNSPEKQLAAWQFIKYFASTDVSAQWSTATGYLPVRKSSAETQTVKDQFAKLPAYQVAVTEIQQYGRPETSVKGTQDTRTFIQDAWTAIIGDPKADPKKLLDDAAQKGNEALQQK